MKNPIRTLIVAAGALNVFALTTSLTMIQLAPESPIEMPAISPVISSTQYEPVPLQQEAPQKKKRSRKEKKSTATQILKVEKPSTAVAQSLPETQAPAPATPTTQTAAPSNDVWANAADHALKWGKKMIQSKQYMPRGGVTFCNTFAADLTNKILGSDSPFLWEKWTAWLQANGRSGRADDMYAYCMEKTAKGEYFEEVTGKDLNERFRKAWEAANQGKLVILASPKVKRKNRTAPGHFAVCVPTDMNDFRSAKDGNAEYFVGRVVQAGASLLDGDKKINGKGGHSYLSAAWRADEFDNIKILICKGTGRS